MRTRQRDANGLTTFGAVVADAASGSGIAAGITFTFTRTATGIYIYRFDVLLLPLTVTATPSAYTGHAAAVKDNGAGTFTVLTLASNAPANSLHYWSCTARDLRVA